MAFLGMICFTFLYVSTLLLVAGYLDEQPSQGTFRVGVIQVKVVLTKSFFASYFIEYSERVRVNPVYYAYMFKVSILRTW